MHRLMVFSCILIFGSLAAYTQDKDIQNILPQDNEIQGFIKEGEPEIYGPDELFFLINGGADLYLEYGFRQVIAQEYQNENQKLKLEVYAMCSDTAAFGVFSSKTGSHGRYEDMGDMGFSGTQYLLIWKGSYFIRISSIKNASKEIIAEFGEKLLEKIPQKGRIPDWVQKVIPQKNLTGIHYIKGPLGLNSFHFFKQLSIGEGLIYKKENMSILVLYHDDENKALSQYQEILNYFVQKADIELLEEGRSPVFRDKRANYIKIYQPQNTYLYLSKGKDQKTVNVDFDELLKSFE